MGRGLIAYFCLVNGHEARCQAGEATAHTNPRTIDNAANQAGITAVPGVATGTIRSFQARGVVRELPKEASRIVISHEAIAGFMPRMTMEFAVRDGKELEGLRPGDQVTFLVKATEEESWIENIRRGAALELPMQPPSRPLASLAHVAESKPGDALPDMELTDEEGRTRQLSEFRGRAVAFTFIFTRCPLPDFCPRMNQRFRQAREWLLAQSNGPTNWQFLSISFDPGFDQPEVLRAYAANYRGESPDRWLFASASTNVTTGLMPKLDFRFAMEGGSFVHNLRTVVLDTKGRIYRQFDGNQWQAEELARALWEAADNEQPATERTTQARLRARLENASGPCL